MNLTRKEFLAMLGSVALTSPESILAQQAPVISRIKYVTIGTPSVADVERWYTEWLGYRVVEKSQVSARMAASLQW